MENQQVQTAEQVIGLLSLRTRRAMSTAHNLRLNYPKDQLTEIVRHAVSLQIAGRGQAARSTSEMLDRMDKITDWLIDPTRPGLLFYGTLGSGKTTIANAICDILKIIKDCTLYRWNAPDIVACAQGKINRGGSIDDIKMASILFIDDLGTEPTEVKDYGNIRMPIVEILEYRYAHQLPVIITTNLNDENIEERYGKRILDRLNEMCARFGFSAKSFR